VLPASEVLQMESFSGATAVPGTEPYVAGLVQVRGRVVPVIDLRKRFGVGERAPDSSTVVIVVRVHTELGEKTAGIVVDAVSEVYSVAPDDIKATPDLGSAADGACVRGLTSVDGKMVMLLDIDKLVTSCVEAT